jgi:hypothetical protein
LLLRRQKGAAVSSGYIPAKGEPDPDEILGALREVVADNPRLSEMPAEKVARQFAPGHLQLQW